MSGDLVQNLKRAGEQVLGAKPLTGNDHVRLSALLKVAALEIEALCAARDDAAHLEAELSKWWSAYVEVAGFLGMVSTDDTGRIGAVAGMEEVLAELEQRERDAAELRAACEAAKSALTALNRVQMYGSADMVRDRAKRALDLIDAALDATEGKGE